MIIDVTVSTFLDVVINIFLLQAQISKGPDLTLQHLRCLRGPAPETPFENSVRVLTRPDVLQVLDDDPMNDGRERSILLLGDLLEFLQFPLVTNVTTRLERAFSWHPYWVFLALLLIDPLSRVVRMDSIIFVTELTGNYR